MFVCRKTKLSANLFLKWPISIIGKMLNIGADNRSTPSLKTRNDRSVFKAVGPIDWHCVSFVCVLLKKLSHLHLGCPAGGQQISMFGWTLKCVVNEIVPSARRGERDGQWSGRGHGGVGRASGQAGESGDGGHPGAAGGSHGGRQQHGGGRSSTQHAQRFAPERRRSHPQLDRNQHHPPLRQRGKHVRLGLKRRLIPICAFTRPDALVHHLEDGMRCWE